MNNASLARLGIIALGFVIVISALDVLTGLLAKGVGLAESNIDIQTPNSLLVKLDAFRNLPGMKVALVGDSVVVGHAMAEHGNAEWRSQTLDRILEQKLQAAIPERSIKVMNFGLNGALPADIEKVTAALLAAKPDLVVLDIGLRAFSRDFSSPGAEYSRPWLRTLRTEADTEGGTVYRFEKETLNLGDRIEAAISDRMTAISNIYRYRDTLQALLFEGKPVDFVRKGRAWANSALKLKTDEEEKRGPMEEMLLALKARERFGSIALDPSAPQLAAFTRTLALLKNSKQSAIVFYAVENPAMINQVIEPDRRTFLMEQLRMHVRQSSGREIQYLEFVAQVPDRYLDHVHLDAEGYRNLADNLLPAATRLLQERPRSVQ
jgi:lysophospholipase L1-like esterase